MLYVNVHSLAEIKSLQARSDEHMRVNLVSLESVRVAAESYALLRPLVDSTSLECSELALLSVVAGLAMELHKLEHDLLPQLSLQEAKLEPGVVDALLLMENSAVTLLHLEEALGGLLDEGLVSDQVQDLSAVLEDTAVLVLERNSNIAKLLEQRGPCLVGLVTDLLATPVRFSDLE